MTTTHHDLIEASQVIGGIADLADWYTRRLAERIEQESGGRTVGELTVAELIQMASDLAEELAQDYARALI